MLGMFNVSKISYTAKDGGASSGYCSQLGITWLLPLLGG